MQVLKNFFMTIWHSVYSPKFYATVAKKSLGSAMGYFFLLILLLTIIQSILPIWVFTTIGQKAIEKFVMQAVSYYPNTLQVTIKNGQVSTNVKEPFFIPFPNTNPSSDLENLVVIDTKTPFTTEQFRSYKAVAWVTKDSIVTQQDNGVNARQIRVIDLSQVSDFTLNKDVVSNIAGKFLPLLRWLPLVVGVGILVGLFFVYMLRLVYAFFLALCLWVILKMMGRSHSYGEAYKVSLYAMTLGFLLDLVLPVMHVNGFPFMFTLVACIVVFVNFMQAPKQVKVAKKKSR